MGAELAIPLGPTEAKLPGRRGVVAMKGRLVRRGRGVVLLLDGGGEIKISPTFKFDAPQALGVSFSLHRDGRVAAAHVHVPLRPKRLYRLCRCAGVVAAGFLSALAGGDAPGVDGISPADYRVRFGESGKKKPPKRDPARLIQHTLHRFSTDDLLGIDPLRKVVIPKSTPGKFRTLMIPTFRDRVAQATLHYVLSPYYERIFSPASFAFRPGRDPLRAVLALKNYMLKGIRWIVSVDLADFFDNIDHELLERFFLEDTRDERITAWVMAFVKVAGTGRGIPQGGPVSPLAANVFLHRFDLWVHDRGYALVRFADDITMAFRKKSHAERAFEATCDFLEGTLRIPVNREKSSIVDSNREVVTILGYSINRGKIDVSEENIEDFQESLMGILNHSREPWDVRRGLFLQSAVSWANLLHRVPNKEISQKLDRWISEALDRSS